MSSASINRQPFSNACGLSPHPLTCRWSAIGRTDRYRKRCLDNGDAQRPEDDTNPLPGFIDPITLEPVVNPAISPYGA